MDVATGLHGKKVAGIEGLPLKSTMKFALLCGVLNVIAAILCSLSFGIRVLSRGGDLGILISGVVFAVPVFLGPYLASRRGWLSSPVSIGRTVLAALPLPFLPVAFFVGMIGWGDMQEHLIRAALHTTHRELPDGIIGALIVVGIVVLGAAAISLLIWISISVLTKRWRAQTLLILWTGCAILSGLFWAALFALKSGGTGVATIGLVLVFICGFLFAFAVEMNATASRMSLVFRLRKACRQRASPNRREARFGHSTLRRQDAARFGEAPTHRQRQMKLRLPPTKHWAWRLRPLQPHLRTTGGNTSRASSV